jgi:hypothetical protein
MQAMETAEAENKAAIERAFPNGYSDLHIFLESVIRARKFVCICHWPNSDICHAASYKSN